MDSAMRFAPLWRDFSRSELDGSGQASSFIRPEFYWRRRREKGKKTMGGQCGWRRLVLWALPTQVEIKYLKHARGFWLSRIFVVLFLFAISLLLPASSPLVLSNLYISFALPFFFPCSITLCVRESIDRRKILSFAADRRCITFGSKFTQQD